MVQPLIVTDDDIHAQLLHLNNILEPSLRGGDAALATFHKGLTKLVTSCAAVSADLSEDTHLRVTSFVKVVHILSSAILEADIAAEKIRAQLETDIARLAEVDFKRLSIHDSPRPQAPYIETCYLWLLGHLHNPYPSKNVRAQFAEQSGAPEKDIDTWFVDARKHIGWNDIRRAYFDTRFDMVKAATRHFKPALRRLRSDSNPDAGPSSDADFSHHFVTMESNARSLHADKFFPTPLSSDLGRSSEPTNKRKAAASSYPSPERTPSPSRFSIPVSSAVVEKRHKRRHSDVDPDSMTVRDPRPQRPLKRNRLKTPSIVADISVVSSLPSPVPSTARGFSSSPAIKPIPLEDASPLNRREKRKRRLSDASDYDSDASRAARARRRRRGLDVHESASPHLITPSKPEPANHSHTAKPPIGCPTLTTPESKHIVPQALKRKRRLSDAHEDRPRKHPHHAALMAPRLQTVSNPFPMPHCVSGVEEIPTSLSTDIPDSAVTLDLAQLSNIEVESFDYGSFSALNDYLIDAGANHNRLDNVIDLAATTTISSEGQTAQSQLPIRMTTLLPLLDLSLPTVSPLSVPPQPNLFSGVQDATNALVSNLWPEFLLSSDKQMTSAPDQTLDFHCNINVFSAQPSGVNPFNLILHPLVNMEHDNMASNPTVAPFGGIPTAPFADDAAITNLALQEIGKLQAQVQMYQARLAQVGVSPF